MATLQKRVSRGHAYWSIVESRRVNGKPRPVILEYLGRAETLLQRLRENEPQRVRSYSHGAVAIMLDIAEQLGVVETINNHIQNKQLRDSFTVGGSLLLGAIGRVCQPTSKRNWYQGWARYTSLEYLLRKPLRKIDSQHFWDQMDVLPAASIPVIEEEIINRLVQTESVTLDTLFCDTSNFFTYIDSTNSRCDIVQRGRNKQKRMDLRQFGLLLLVTRADQIPIIHRVYQGNLTDRTVFKEQFKDLMKRFKAMAGSLEQITLVFDQGNNSKKMLDTVNEQIKFVGALSPYQHKSLIERANKHMDKITVNTRPITCYREESSIWGLDLTSVVYISERLLKGQIRGIEQGIQKLFEQLSALRNKFEKPTLRGRKRVKEGVEKKIKSLIDQHAPKGLIGWSLKPLQEDAFHLDYWIEQKPFDLLKKNTLGRRILITNRHQWATQEIILAYWGQSKVEGAFKRIKDPFHLAVRPQYHWTDQKIQVHGFICVLGLLLAMLAYKRARERADFNGTLHTLLEKLNAIRLATFLEAPLKQSKGRYNAVYRLEEMDEEIQFLAEKMGLVKDIFKTNIPFSVYA
jgi:transposase